MIKTTRDKFCRETAKPPALRRVRIVNNVILLTPLGFSQNFNYNTQLILLGVYMWAVILAEYILPAQAFYRYYTLVHKRSMSLQMTMLLFVMASVISIPTGYIAYLSYAYSGLQKPGFNYGTYWFIERPLPTLLLADMESNYLKLLVAIVIPCAFIAYSLSLTFAWKTLRYLRTHIEVQSAQTLKLQRQLSQCLLMQNILPLFTSATPVACYTIPILFGIQSDKIVTYASMCLSLVPIGNPIISILVISPYKATVLRWLDKIVCGLLTRHKIMTKAMMTSTKSGSMGPIQFT
ncbi:unnamed protein product [Bursaphelenchus okinawaensis]|uniref:G_PROTEIN_RECEP_F1_2 domain-containing protein n=1 Tax=Bursaphelenchus okinawaensis TaxID=465554 RepID=A0A811L4Z7_9BILA|nr:unnamed protein product [Bursaphelenchus okinawaensis]CAG9117337.1 unnamed protein product [Bursaphelenchus okinawaensis]